MKNKYKKLKIIGIMESKIKEKFEIRITARKGRTLKIRYTKKGK
jgi:hypothetical protein